MAEVKKAFMDELKGRIKKIIGSFYWKDLNGSHKNFKDDWLVENRHKWLEDK